MYPKFVQISLEELKNWKMSEILNDLPNGYPVLLQTTFSYFFKTEIHLKLDLTYFHRDILSAVRGHMVKHEARNLKNSDLFNFSNGLRQFHVMKST